MPLTQRERMTAGEPYRFSDPELVAARRKARDLVRALNRLDMEDEGRHAALLAELGLDLGPGAAVLTPFRCTYGFNIRLAAGAFLNQDCLVLDNGPVAIGAGAMLGPRVSIYTAVHPLDVAARARHQETTRAVTIGENAWIGGSAVLLPGVGIGRGSVVGAGAVVTRDVPPGVVVAGNPARIIRQLEGEPDEVIEA